MPNRVLRDWTASEKIDSLTEGAEVFFTRLIMKADDFGLYSANHKFLKSTLFPLKDITENQVSIWLGECLRAGMIKKYRVDGKEYLQILNFDQRTRIQKAKYPLPDKCQSDDGQLTVNCQTDDGLKRNENEIETKPKPKPSEPDFEQFDIWTKSIIDGNDFVFAQKFQNEFPNWGGGAALFVEIVNDHLDLLNRYPKMNPNTQERFRNSCIKHFRETKDKTNGKQTSNKRGIDIESTLQHIAQHGASGHNE